MRWAQIVAKDTNRIVQDMQAELSEDDGNYLLLFTRELLRSVFVLKRQEKLYETMRARNGKI